MEASPERPYNITITVPTSDGPFPDPAEFAAAAELAASERGANGVISAHTAKQIISVITVSATAPIAATAVAWASYPTR